MKITQALNRNVAPHISVKVQKMTAKELRNRFSFLFYYLRNVSPRVSIYKELRQEYEECEARLRTP